MRRSAGLAASLFLSVLSLAGCGSGGGVIGSGPQPTPSPIVPSVTNEFPIPTASSQPGGITLGVDTFLYFTERATNTIGQVGTGGAFNEFNIAKAGGAATSAPFDIITGPDGNLWYTYYNSAIKGGGVAMMSIGSHQVTEYPLTGTSPTYIAAGPVQNTLVFSNPGSNQLVEFNISTFAVATVGVTANSNPMGLAINHGDATHVYFAEHDASKIGIWDLTTNTVQEIPTLTPNAGPTQITEGPDHNMWFTENNVAKIGRISTNGQMLPEYPLAPATSAPALVTARDNNVYFIDALQNKIGSISGVTPATVNEFAVPTAGAFPAPGPSVYSGAMTLGPDGRVYFTEPAANKIGQLNY